MPRKRDRKGITALPAFCPPLHIGRLRPSGCPATENLSLTVSMWPTGPAEGHSGGVVARHRRVRSRKASGAGVRVTGSTCGLGACFLNARP